MADMTRGRRRGRPDIAISPWAAVAFVAAALALVPIVAIAATAVADTGGLWGHIIQFVLPQSTWNTLVLLAGSGLIATMLGTGAAWIVSAYDFRGRGFLEWALLLPLARADLYHGLCLSRHSEPARSGSGRTALDTRLFQSAGVPPARPAGDVGRHPGVRLRALPVRLSDGTGYVSNPGGQCDRSCADAGRAALRDFLAGGAAIGTAGHRGRGVAGADGSAQRCGGRSIPGRAHIDGHHIHHLDRAHGSCRSGSDRYWLAGAGSGCAYAGAMGAA